jgi:DNA modification methylase
MAGISWQEAMVSLSRLKPYERNPRRISKDQLEKLKASIEQDGFHQRILCTPDFKVIGGHQRIRVLKELGWKEVQVLTPSRELTDDEYRRLLIRDNLQAGEWDMDALANDFTPEELTDWGFPEDLLPKQEGVVNDPQGDEDEAPEAPAIAKTVRGDVYEIGPHRLMCGDSTLIDDVDKLMDGAKADMVFTDPPYGMSYSGRGENTSNGILGDDSDPTALYAVGMEIPERYVWGRFENYAHLPEAPRDVIIWRKNNFGMGAGYRGQYECCFYYGSFKGSDSDVWDVSKDSKYEHPTQKPIALCERAIKNSQPKHIIDYFGGSGSTMVAAHKLGRTAYLMELDEKYCDVIVTRMAKLFPDLPVKRNGEPFAPSVAPSHA